MRTLALLALVLGCASGGRRPGRPDAGRADAGLRDASAFDASRPTPDAGHDAALPTSCRENADCQDTSACNGQELCIGGVCMAGTPMACDDGVACTADSCSEPGTCVHTPNDALCGAGETCGPSGCVVGGPSCAETPCKVVAPQCGCPSGQGCYPDVDGNRSCETVGSVVEGGACTAITDCRPGLSCLDIGGGRAACHRLCDIDSDCATGALCIIELQDTAMRPLDFQACTLPCDPARQTGCPPGASCFLGAETAAPMRPLTHCSGEPSGSRGQGMSCSADSDCQAGYICLQPDTLSRQQCLHLCRNPNATSPGPSPDCPSGLDVCYGFDPPIQVGATRYGVCWDGT